MHDPLSMCPVRVGRRYNVVQTAEHRQQRVVGILARLELIKIDSRCSNYNLWLLPKNNRLHACWQLDVAGSNVRVDFLFREFRRIRTGT